MSGAGPEITGHSGSVRVRPSGTVDAKQGIPYFLGISGASARAPGISLTLVVVPPGGRAEPHSHSEFESALYVISGNAVHHWGERLEHAIDVTAGDFLYIAPGVPHFPENASTSDPVIAVVARNDPDEQEHVILYEPPA
ncbi:cupin domain-containing protein [soil metagenome]